MTSLAPRPALDPRSTPSLPVDTARTITDEARNTSRILRGFRPDIQGLRAVAVLLVVLYHASVPGISGGYIGVDVFFVISGFLITGNLVRQAKESGQISLSAFYAGRIRRLLPSAAVVTVLTVLAARLWGSVFQIRSVGWDAVLTAVYGINYRLAIEGVQYQNADDAQSPLQHFWSLAVEEQFYVLWPLMLIVCLVLVRRRFKVLAALLLLAVFAGSLWLSITLTATDAPLAYFSIQSRAWELAAGALLSLVASRLVRMPTLLSALLGLAGLGAIIWSAVTYTNETPFPGHAALVPVLGTTAVLAAGCAPARFGVELLLARRPMQGVGAVSYSWYLWHWPLIIMVPLMFDRTFQWWEKAELGFLGLWFAVMTYWAVESTAKHSALTMRGWLVGGVALALVVVVSGVGLVTTVPTTVGSGAAAQTLALNSADSFAVKEAVGKATLTTAVPSNLQPSLSAAPEDQPTSSKNGCHADYLQIDQGPCVYGDPAGQHTIVLFGDSHAQQWLPALDTEAKAQHWKLIAWTKAACSIAAYDVYVTQLQRPYGECLQWRDKTMARIIQVHPDMVLVGQSDSVPADRLGNNEWGADTVTTLRRFQQSKINFAYIMDTPYPGVNVPECVARHLSNIGACTIKRKGTWPYAGRHEALAASLQAAGINTIEPVDWLCSNVNCPVVVGNILVYRDTTHMSATYSSWLAPMLSPLFGTAPAKPQGS